MEYWWALVVIGLGCGVYSGLFGVGAGTLLIPLLVLVFGLPQKSAQGVCLAVMVPMVLAGAIRYRLNPDIEVDLRIVGLLAAGGVVGALVGASVAGILPGVLLRRLFAVLIILLAVKMFFTADRARKAVPPDRPAARTDARVPGG